MALLKRKQDFAPTVFAHKGSTMKNRQLTARLAVSLTVLGFTFLHNPAQAQDGNAYNAGLLASEAGDYRGAVVAWQPLAREGNGAAQFNLALMYHGGLGVAQSEQEAVRWYQKSAANGYGKAQEFLAAAYREGWFGLKKNVQKADYWNLQLENKP
jgi:TPR repeat protein